VELRGNINSVQQMEAMLRSSWGVELYHDGSKGFPIFGKDGHQSRAFTRVYHVPLEEGMRAFIPWATVRFWYDERVGRASMQIPQNSVKALTERGILAHSGQGRDNGSIHRKQGLPRPQVQPLQCIPERE